MKRSTNLFWRPFRRAVAPRSSRVKIVQQTIVGGDDGVGQVAFGLLQLEHFLFHGVARNQPISKHLARLADAMRTIDGLSFYRWVPPRIEQINVFSGVEVESQAARFQG